MLSEVAKQSSDRTGGKRDYQRLVDLGVNLKGNIALAKYGGTFRGLKVQYAQEQGMVAVLIYSDPGDDGDITEANGYAAYPAGPARNPSSVQRGTVMFLNMTGDPVSHIKILPPHLCASAKMNRQPPDILRSLASKGETHPSSSPQSRHCHYRLKMPSRSSGLLTDTG